MGFRYLVDNRLSGLPSLLGSIFRSNGPRMRNIATSQLFDSYCVYLARRITIRSSRPWILARQSLVVAWSNLPEYLAAPLVSPLERSLSHSLFSHCPNSSYSSLRSFFAMYRYVSVEEGEVETLTLFYLHLRPQPYSGVFLGIVILS